MIVQVYRNLHNRLLSIQDAKTGLVIGHATTVDLKDATFIVREAGRQRVLKEKKKNVHAFVKGTLTDVINFKPFKDREVDIEVSTYIFTTRILRQMRRESELHGKEYWGVTEVRYNPYKAPHFVESDGEAVHSMSSCVIESIGTIRGYT